MQYVYFPRFIEATLHFSASVNIRQLRGVAIALITISCFAGCANLGNPVRSNSENQELALLYVEDQTGRTAVGSDIVAASNLGADDLTRRTRVKQIYAENALKTGSDFYHAALILQHGYTADDYLLAHEFSVIALSKGEMRAKWLAAATEDRFLMQLKRPQRFGTQFFQLPEGKWEMYTTSDGVSDYLRSQLDVPTIAEAVRKQGHLNGDTGKIDSRQSSESMRAEPVRLPTTEANTDVTPDKVRNVTTDIIDGPIVGRWSGSAPNGGPLEFNFLADHRLVWQSHVGTVNARYDVAQEGDFIEVDIYDFDRKEFRGERLVAIAKVRESTLTFEATSMKEAEAQGRPIKRPKNFGDEAMKLILQK